MSARPRESIKGEFVRQGEPSSWVLTTPSSWSSKGATLPTIKSIRSLMVPLFQKGYMEMVEMKVCPL